MRTRIAVAVVVALTAAPALAWNATGHKTVAEIAWHRITPEQRQAIVDTLRRHPVFDKDFAGKMPDDVQRSDKATQDHWIFQQAACWPDVARGGEYDRPWWHFINLPIFVDPADEEFRDWLPFNQSFLYPTSVELERMNAVQCIKYAKATIADANASQPDKALAYCWLFHVVGDIHQPLHAVSLISSDQFPEGDRGGNEIPLRRGRNLHSLWDGLLGRDERMQNIDRVVVELSDRTRYGDVWDTAAKETDPSKWAAESVALCKSDVYSAEILDAVRATRAGDRFPRITLPTSYMQNAGEIARRRIITAGVRLGAMLNTKSAAR